MPQDNDDSLVNLPEGLRGQFARVQRRLWQVETTAAAGAIAASLLFSLLAVFISDRLWETPVWLRVFLFLCGLAGAAAAALDWARHWLWNRRDLRALAALVQKKYRRLGDRLLGIVELAGEQKHLSNFSPALYHAAIQQVAGEAQKFDFLQSVSTRAAKRFGWTAGALSLVLLAASGALPQASWNAFLRWIQPGANVGRYTLVALDGFPRELIVPHGEPFAIAGAVRYRSFWKPSRVLARLGPLAKTESAVQSDQIRLRIPGQVERGVLRVRVGDALARVEILPSHRPSLQQLSALVHLPDYLRYPDQSQAVQNGSLRAVEGSRIAFRGTVSRPLASAAMQDGDANPAPLQVQGQDFSSEPAEPSGLGQFTFSWRDQLGLTNATPWRLSVQPQPDAPPVPDLPDLPRTAAMLATDVLRVRAEASDDFGVRDLGLVWDVVSDLPPTDSMATETKIEMTSPRQKKTEKTFLWSPSLYRIPPDSTVELQAFARDYFPNRARVRTASYFIRVLSPEEHAEMLRAELEAIMAQIEDITRLQEKIVAETRSVQDDAKDLTEAQQSSRLNQGKEDQLQNAQRLQELTRQGENTVREAMKNPLMPEDSIRQWSRTLQQWQQLSQEKMREAARAMQAAAQNAQSRDQTAGTREQASQSPEQNSQSQPREQTSPFSPQASPSKPQNSPSQNGSQSQQQNSQSQQQNQQARQEDLAEAVKRAGEILEALRQMEQNANQHLDQLQAFTLAQRLRKVGDQEMSLTGRLTTNLADTIGLLPRDLPEKFKQLNYAFVQEQAGARDESAALQSEISRFFERTQMTNYGKVSKDMKESRATDELDRMGALIQSNITMQTTLDLTNWSGRFQKWAEELQPKTDPSQSGQQAGQGQAGGQKIDMTQVLLALLRMREREMNLRDQTSVLEAGKENAADYKEQAGLLSGAQRTLADLLARLHKATPVPELDLPFHQSAAAMNEVRELLDKPQTDSVTDSSELKTVDQLSDLINLINEQAQHSQPQPQPSAQPGDSASSAEEMAYLLRMMRNESQARPAMQPTGLGNMAGGVTGQTGRPVSGSVDGKSQGARNVNKTAGAIENYPAEFRDALENYFHGVENPAK